MTRTKAGNLWPQKSVVVVSEEIHLNLLIKELVREIGWKVDLPSCAPATAIELVNSNKAQCIIVIESPERPASETLRVLFKEPRVRLTPILVLLQDENAWEQSIYEKIFRVGVAIKPLRPNNFNPAFNRLIKTWELPIMHALRRVASIPDNGPLDKKLDILERLCSDGITIPFALSALLQHLVREGRYKDAARKAITIFKDHHTSPAVLAACAWFYVSTRTPQLAIRYLNKLRTVAPSSLAFHFDLASAYVACGQLNEALKIMNEWNERRPGNGRVESFLARLIIADGKQDSRDLAKLPPNLLRKVADYWDAIESAIEIEKNGNKPGLKAS